MSPRAVTALLLVLSTLGLTAFGAVNLASVSEAADLDEFRVQVKWMAIAAVVGTASVFVPFRWLLARGYLLYAAALGLLGAVLLVGRSIKGSRRWLDLGGLSVQPSEVMKFVFLIAMARCLRYEKDLGRPSALVRAALLAVLPVGLILAQPNLSTATLFIPTAFGMLFVGGASKRHLTAILIGAALVAGLGSMILLKPYQKDRIMSTIMRDRLSPAEQQREGYQLERSLRSVAIGGVTGQGWKEGVQNRLNVLAERHNDFIFALAAEEFGFVGCLAIIVLILTALFAMGRIAIETREPGGRYFTVGAAVLFGLQSFLHIGVNLGLIPSTGMTMRFVSAGGSSLITFTAITGTVLGIARRQIPVLAGDVNQEQMDRLRSL